jgi:hypothetical protein
MHVYTCSSWAPDTMQGAITKASSVKARYGKEYGLLSWHDPRGTGRDSMLDSFLKPTDRSDRALLALFLLTLRDLLPLVLGADAGLALDTTPLQLGLGLKPGGNGLHLSSDDLVFDLGVAIARAGSCRRAILCGGGGGGLGLLALLVGDELGGEPVDGPPEAAAKEGEDDEVVAVCGDEQDQERELQGGETGVCGDENGGRWAGNEDGLPEVDEKGRHGGG